MTRTGWRLLLVALVALATRVARADEAKASMVVPPEKLEWKPSAALPAGAQIAVLQGAQTKPGPYAYRVRLPPHYRVPPHAHSDDRTYVFLSGTYYQGHGDRFDASRLAPVRAGTFEAYVAGEQHYGETRDEEVIFQVNGNGPTAMTYASPADDPRKR